MKRTFWAATQSPQLAQANKQNDLKERKKSRAYKNTTTYARRQKNKILPTYIKIRNTKMPIYI